MIKEGMKVNKIKERIEKLEVNESKEYNGKKIKDGLRDGTVFIVVENGYKFYYSYYGNLPNNFYIILKRLTGTKVFIYPTGLSHNDKEDSRPKFIEVLFDLKEKKKDFSIFLDFRKKHNNGKIHLNIRLNNGEKVKKNSRIYAINHLEVVFIKENNIYTIDYFQTFLKVLNVLKKQKFILDYIDFEIMQIYEKKEEKAMEKILNNGMIRVKENKRFLTEREFF
jgi:hypothetical protein